MNEFPEAAGAVKRKKAKKVRPFKVAATKAFVHPVSTSQRKVAIVRALVLEYRKAAKDVARVQMRLFHAGDKFAQDCDLSSITTKLSQRYLRCCNYQVVGMLRSWYSNRKNEYLAAVRRSSLPEALKNQLSELGVRQAWYHANTDYPATTLRLARNIMRGICAQHRMPRYARINMTVNKNVAVWEVAKTTKAHSHWIALSTLEAGKRIYLPITPNSYFESVKGVRCEAFNIMCSDDGALRIALMKDVPAVDYTPSGGVLALDFGLSVMFATSEGDLCGAAFYRRLQQHDRQLSQLARGRQKAGLKVRCPKYDALVNRLRGYFKNEVGRIFNALVARYKPSEIIVEKLNFQSPELSRRTNRLLSNCGRRYVNEKLVDLEKRFGIKVTEIYAAYTSQECTNCHYTAKDNRKSRSQVVCKVCGKKMHADISGARNGAVRRSAGHLGNRASSHAIYGKALLSELGNAHKLWRAHHAQVRREQGRRSAACHATIAGPNTSGDSGVAGQRKPELL